MTKVNDFMLESDREEKAARIEQRRREWEKIRTRGEVRFLLIKGILRFALPISILYIFFDIFDDHKSIGLFLVARDFGIPAFTGLILGLWEWHSNEKRFQNSPRVEMR